VKPVRTFASIAAAVAAAALLSACGNQVPPNAVAKVGDTTISKETFDHWLQAAAQSSQAPGTKPEEIVVPEPPDFTQCVEARSKQELPKGSPEPTEQQLKDQCKAEYDLLKEQVMQFLLQAEAIEQEAGRRGIEVTDEEVGQKLEELKSETFKKPGEFEKFLETSGRTEADLLFQTRVDMLSEQLRSNVVEAEGPPTDAEIQDFYDENGDQPPLGQPETRNLQIVLTEDEAQANKAKQEIEDGADFADVAQKYSIDELSKQNDGKLEGVAEGQQEATLDKAVFAAKEDTLQGPIETPFGWYVFRVTGITPEKKPPLDEIRDTVVELVTQQREQELLNRFIEDFQKRSKEETACAKGYEVQSCSNAPKVETPQVPGAPPVPQGGTPVPQGGTPVPQGGTPVPQGGPPPSGAPPAGAPPAGAPPQGGTPPPPPPPPPPPDGGKGAPPAGGQGGQGGQ
jgi:parvulin-like peptidyl-prolyl isomerase